MRLAVPALLAALAGCGAPREYLGIDLAATPPTALQRLASAAQSGDKYAQLELGRLFEDGRGVPEDAERACRLYASAAATTGGTQYVYSPPVGKGAGRVIPITTPVRPGLDAARERLAALRYRVVSGSGCLSGR